VLRNSNSAAYGICQADVLNVSFQALREYQKAVEDVKTMIVTTMHVCSKRNCKFSIKPFFNKGGLR
jgi:hypothetical protein